MAKTFDFNKFKPKTMTVTLSDEEKTTLIITTPDKKLMDELTILRDSIEDAEDEEIEEALYELTAKVMSRNKNNVKITTEKLKELFDDVGYVMAFLEAYVDFVNEIKDSKN